MSAVPVSSEAASGKTALAVFDFDGTCIDGQSGSLISTYLLRNGFLSPLDTIRLAWWGARYKMHLPHKQEVPRKILLGALNRRMPEDISRIMVEIHDAVLVPRYRKQSFAEVRSRKDEGMVTLLASATFLEVARCAADHLNVDGFIATKMERDQTGAYTGNVEGDVIEGKAKLHAVAQWADEHLGKGSWYIACAYGDHHSDSELLAAASQPFAVCPGKTLKRLASRRGWPILDWHDEG